MRYARYPIVFVLCCIGTLLPVCHAAAETGAGFPVKSPRAQTSSERSAAARLQIQDIESEIRQMQADMQPLQTQLNVAVARQNSLLGTKPLSPQGSDRKAWQAYDRAANTWQARLAQSQDEVNRIRQRMSARQSEVQAKQEELKQVQIDAGLVSRDEEYQVPPPTVRLPGSRIPGDPRGLLDD